MLDNPASELDLGPTDSSPNPEIRLMGIANYCGWLMDDYSKSARDLWHWQDLTGYAYRLAHQGQPPGTQVSTQSYFAVAAKEYEKTCDHHYKRLRELTYAMVKAGIAKELDTCKVLALFPKPLHQDRKTDWAGLKSELSRIQRVAVEKLEELRASAANQSPTRPAREPDQLAKPATPGPALASPDPLAAGVADGFYSPTDIAKAVGNPRKAEAIRKLLGRMMTENQLPGTAWLENSNPASGQAKILFRLSAVRPHLSRYES